MANQGCLKLLSSSGCTKIKDMNFITIPQEMWNLQHNVIFHFIYFSKGQSHNFLLTSDRFSNLSKTFPFKTIDINIIKIA